jgi:hypothetical protein
MSGGKHTPGPWRIFNSTDIFPDDNDTEGLRQIADCSVSEHIPFTEQQANARLIAAAPETAAERDRLKVVNAELLAVLKRFRTKVYNAAIGNGMDDEWATAACSVADAAIAKAEGGAA